MQMGANQMQPFSALSQFIDHNILKWNKDFDYLYYFQIYIHGIKALIIYIY